jgi:rRNA maturation endonuclease Nob1
MVVLFESYGNFTSGQTSYRALISKKSRGTITLTDKEFLFKSEKDNILFHLRMSDIENFSVINRFKLPTIELISVQGIIYTFYPHKKESSSLTTSKKATEDLFRELTRSTFKKESPILFETIGNLKNSESEEEILTTEALTGVIFLNEDYLSFKPFTEKSITQILILNIDNISGDTSKSGPGVKIQTKDGKFHLFMTLKKHIGRYTNDRTKTERLLELINNAKIYKSSEQTRLKKEEKEKIDRIKSMMEVSHKLRLDMVRTALDMDDKLFTEKVFQWAKQFNFLIDGDYLVINQETASDFLNDLSTGTNILSRRGVKIKCRFCERLIEYGAKICPYCGKETENS